MNSSIDYAKTQYGYVLESRKTLLEFCDTILPVRLHEHNPVFGNGGSVISLFVHVVNTYESWIVQRALGKKINFSVADAQTNLEHVKTMFAGIDQHIDIFFQTYQRLDETISYERNGITTIAPALKLFSHVITHEYHHKGQVLSLARSLGYIPVDTDILR